MFGSKSAEHSVGRGRPMVVSPAAEAGVVAWYIKDVAGVPELFSRGQDGVENQLTSGGAILGTSIKFDSVQVGKVPKIDSAGKLTEFTDATSEVIYDFGDNVPGVADRNGLGCSQTRVGAGDLALNGAAIAAGAWACPFSGGRLITIYSPNNIAGVVFTIYGTDYTGAAQSGTATGVNNSTVECVRCFWKTVTRVECGGACAAVEIGFSDGLLNCDLALGTHFRIDPENGADVTVVMTGNTGAGSRDRASIKLERPAGGDFSWAHAVGDHTFYFAGGAEPVPTASGTDWYEFVCDNYTPGGAIIWYCSAYAQDIKA